MRLASHVIREQCTAVLSESWNSRLTLLGIAGLTVASAVFGVALPQSPAVPLPSASVARVDGTNVIRLPQQDVVLLLGQRVRGPGGIEIGRLVGVLVDNWGEPRAAILDMGGVLASAADGWQSTGMHCASHGREAPKPWWPRSTRTN